MDIFFKDKRELGMYELKKDNVFRRIPADTYDDLITLGWQTGETAAYETVRKVGSSVPSKMAKLLNLKIEMQNWEQGSGNIRLYSEYEDKFRRITLYRNVIDKDIDKLKLQGFDKLQSFAAAREFFLAHEIFHYLECNELGLTSKKRTVVTLQLGPVKLTSGIRALSEIGSHAFTRTLYEVNHGYPDLQKVGIE